MSEDRQWMYNRLAPGRASFLPEFIEGVKTFIDYACTQEEFRAEGKLRCPCFRCENCRYLDVELVKVHIFQHGFTGNYYQWTSHGEPYLIEMNGVNTSNGSSSDCRDEEVNRYREMVIDAAGPSITINEGTNIEEEPNARAKMLYGMLRAAEEPLYNGCANHSQLSLLTRMLTIESDFNMSRECFNAMDKLISEIVPLESKVPKTFYNVKKLAASLGLPHEKIHCCINSCILYRGEYKEWDHCRFCEHHRWKPTVESSRKKKAVSYAAMHYLPLTPRLQRLYASPATSSQMRWHKEHLQTAGELIHPSDAEAWKTFNRDHSSFSVEHRYVRLGLCTDGFAPFGQSGKQYSCWPVILTPYNLPP